MMVDLHTVDSNAPWGDYGSILVNGMSRHLPKLDGLIQLERTGPFVPCLSVPVPVDVIVTERTRAKLVESNLSGATFRPVHRTRIVHSDWHTWNIGASRPARIPTSGEPEDYVLAQPHDRDCAETIGPLWELVASQLGQGTLVVISKRPRAARVSVNLDARADFLRVNGVGALLVSDRARSWIETALDRTWIRFGPVEVESG